MTWSIYDSAWPNELLRRERTLKAAKAWLRFVLDGAEITAKRGDRSGHHLLHTEDGLIAVALNWDMKNAIPRYPSHNMPKYHLSNEDIAAAEALLRGDTELFLERDGYGKRVPIILALHAVGWKIYEISTALATSKKYVTQVLESPGHYINTSQQYINVAIGESK